MSDGMLPEDDPIVVGFAKFKASRGYDNTAHWARHGNDLQREGSLWAAYLAGWEGALDPSRIEARARVAELEAEVERLESCIEIVGDTISAMQACLIEHRHGDRDKALAWIENQLDGPGLLPPTDATDAQLWYDNRRLREASGWPDNQGQQP